MSDSGRKSFRSSLGTVRHLGSAKEGAGHWWVQRLTSIALVPLVIWFAFSIVYMAGEGAHADVLEWLSNPVVAVAAILTLFAAFYHAALGCQVIAEDYVSHEGARMAVVWGVYFLCFVLGTACIFSVLKISFGG